MGDFDIREKMPPGQPDPYEANVEAGRSDMPPPITGFTSAAQWGLASLLIGCTLLVAACVTLVFNVLLFRGGPAGIPTALAFAGGLIGALAVSALGLASLLFGIWSCQQAYAVRSSPALGVAGLGASLAGLGSVADRFHRLDDDLVFVQLMRPSGILSFRGMNSLQPARQLSRTVRPLITWGEIAMTQPETPLPAREPSMLGRITRATIGAVIAAMAGIAALVIVGMLVAWEALGDAPFLIAAVVGALLGGVLRGFGDWPVRSLAGAVGGFVGGFVAMAAAENFPPGSAEWAVHGGLRGAVCAVPVAALVAVAAGTIAALIRPRT